MAKEYSIQIRFADIDVMGHVNNANYLHYFETARLHFFNDDLPEWDWKNNGILLAKNEVEYIYPVAIRDKISVQIYCSRIGDKSFDLKYHVVDKQGKIYTEGKSIIVCYDYVQQKSIPIPAKILEVLRAHDATNS